MPARVYLPYTCLREATLAFRSGPEGVSFIVQTARELLCPDTL